MDTINSLIEESCRKFGDKTAFLHKVGGVWRATSYCTLRETSERIAAGLSGHGFQPGDHAALLAPSSPQWVVACLGILKAGGVVVPIDRELKSGELRHILAHSEARTLFTDRDSLDTLLEMTEGLPSLRLIVILEPHGDPGRAASDGALCAAGCPVLTVNHLLAEAGHSPPPRLPRDTALILYTSGTTGRSKGPCSAMPISSPTSVEPPPISRWTILFTPSPFSP